MCSKLIIILKFLPITYSNISFFKVPLNDPKITSAGVPTNAPVAPAAIPKPAFMKNPKEKEDQLEIQNLVTNLITKKVQNKLI